jgi:class 3 adenylate cyclase
MRTTLPGGRAFSGPSGRPHRPYVFGFASRLFTALLLAVALVLGITLLVVRQQTELQVSAATDRVAEQSRRAFREMESAQRLRIEQLGRAFTGSPRTSAALEAALESGDMHWLAETARYELALGMLPQSLAVFTDAAGEPVITLIDGEAIAGDAAHIRSLVARLDTEQTAELLAYRVVHDRLHLLQLHALDFDGYRIGTVAFGVPVSDRDVDDMGAMLGAEICLVALGRCLAGSMGADPAMRAVIAEHAHREGGAIVQYRNANWLLVSAPIAAAAPTPAWRVMAVPMAPVIGPFADIRRALHYSGTGALVLAVLLSVMLSRGLTRPVRTLVAATARVGSGDYTVRVPVARQDELGTLAIAFNTMTEGLLLKERYRGVLDKVVSPQVAADLMKGEIRLGGETREVTTLFADITAFSELVDGMEPPLVVALLNECMAHLEAVVQAHGGVVDKYIGDEIMAIFGAPVAHGNDAANAVKAALDMQSAMRQLNRERERRGEAALTLAVGLHSGPVLAGNMGSPNRLNYTVVGDSVNLAKRLCSAASPGQVLLTQSTWERVRHDVGDVHARPLGTRVFKGFATPLPIVAVDRDAAAPTRATSSLRIATGAATVAVASAMLLFAAPAGPLHAQGDGIHIASRGGSAQLTLSARLDLEGYVPQDEPTWLIAETEPFASGRASLFTDVFLGDRLYGLIELRADRGHAPADAQLTARVEQAFVRLRPLVNAAATLQVGRFASPFGAYAARHHGPSDPLIRPPLPYDQRTLVTPRVAPGGLSGFLAWKDSAVVRRVQGAPVVWDVPYPWGALATFALGGFGARAAVLGSAPSSAPESWLLSTRRFRRPSLMAGVAWRVVPDLTLGSSWSRGPYLEPLRGGSLPDGAALTDFVQQTFAFDAAFARGSTAIHAELFLNRWEVPNLTEDPLDTSFYIETATRLGAGLFVSARYGAIRYNRMGTGTSGARAGERWDLNQQRLQIGGGYSLSRHTEVRVEYLINRTAGGDDPRDNLLSARLRLAF